MIRYLVLAFTLCLPLVAHASDSATLVLEMEAIDLDTGDVLAFDGVSGDVRFTYQTGSASHALPTVVASQVALAHLVDVAFSDVTAQTAESVSFDEPAPSQAIGPVDTLLVRTDSGAVFKLGNANELDGWLTFDYEFLYLGEQP